MTRHEAVQALMTAWLQRDSEFCTSYESHKMSEAELHEALLALGVTRDEIAEAWDD